MHMGGVTDGHHCANGGIDPTGPQLGIFGKLSWGASQKFCESGAKCAGRVKSCTQLGLDDPIALGQNLGGMAQSAVAGHFQKRHAKMSFEGAPYG